MTRTLLLLCDEGADLEALEQSLQGHGLSFISLESVDAAVEARARDPWLAALVCDDPGRTRLDGFLRQRPEGAPPVLGAVRQGDVASAVRAMRLGAHAIVEMPPGQMLPSTSAVVAALDELLEAAGSSEKRDPRDAILRAPDSPMNGILDVLPQIARSDAPVFLTGESGTGKDLLAKVIHGLSDRAGAPLIAVNCGAIPDELLESELFGYQRGAFTGAVEDRAGQFEAADGSTIFLDEIGEMPPALQVKLLRVLQEKRVLRLGATTPIPLDFRVIAATNRDIEQDIEQDVERGRFREDLYYRLSVLPVHMPALRERPQDIPVLYEHFIDRQNQINGTDIVDVTREVRTLLKRHEWPGNVRELQNLVERICILKRSGFIERDDLPASLLDSPPAPMIGLDVPSEGIDMTDVLDRLEHRLLTRALRKAEGNKARAARLLGINRTTLVEKLKRKQITLDDI